MITEIELIEECCINCGIPFWITIKDKVRLQNSHEDFYCPRGHGQHYAKETEAERLRKAYDEALAEKGKLLRELTECKSKLPVPKRGRPKKQKEAPQSAGDGK
jgi:hypothetical protein